ncbi:MAG: integrase core domain-containing protein, partial [Vitreimonas sp.]
MSAPKRRFKLTSLLTLWPTSCDHPTRPRAPWRNGHVERLIGSIRRERLDCPIILNAANLRRVLRDYAEYYNSDRTHWLWARIRRLHGLSRPVAASFRAACWAVCTGDTAVPLRNEVSRRDRFSDGTAQARILH